jgi:stage V sporulation protein R
MATTFGLRVLPDELVAVQNKMEGYARDYGLDFFPTIFELVDNERLHALASFGGFPTRFPHWRFGMEYERLAKGYQYGLSKIYEMVINHDPCYAYLLSSNEFTDHKLVMAHVYGHCDFFKNNAWFAPTNRRMIDVMVNHGQRVRKYVDRYGQEKVESFIDACLSLEDLIDIHSPHIRRPSIQSTEEPQDDDREPSKTTRLPAKSYMDRHINPPSSDTAGEDEEQRTAKLAPIPAQPTRDVLLFLLDHGPLESWQADILSIIRDEAYYFAPQAQTKIMNEGWATYWHSTIMTQHGMEPTDLVCYADHCAGVLASSPTQLNPYKLGVELFRDIEDRWNRGRHGSDYDECTDMQARANCEPTGTRKRAGDARRSSKCRAFTTI